MIRPTHTQVAGLLIFMAVLPIIGPFVSVSLNIYRIDIVATLVFGPLIAVLIFANAGKFDRLTRIVVALFSSFCVIVVLHNFPAMQRVQIGDALFWLYPLGYLFCVAYLARLRDLKLYISSTRILYCVLVPLITVPALVEIALGQPLLIGSQGADWTDGAVKGLFYNPNDMGALSVVLAAGIAPFFCAEHHSTKSKWLGYFMISVMGAVVFLSGSRAAMLLYLLGLFAWAFVRANMALKLAAVVSCIALSVNQFWLTKQFLAFTSGIDIFARPSERYLLLIERAAQDGSISYRAEIVTVFFDRLQWLWIGYGTRNFSDYFRGSLSDPLGETLPHVFLIETYLSFGVVGLAIMVAILVTFAVSSLPALRIHTSTAIWFLAILFMFLASANIPSTITRLPAIWIPVFASFVLMRMLSSRRQFATAESPPRRRLDTSEENVR